MTIDKANEKSIRLTALDSNGEIKVFLIVVNWHKCLLVQVNWKVCVSVKHRGFQTVILPFTISTRKGNCISEEEKTDGGKTCRKMTTVIISLYNLTTKLACKQYTWSDKL